MYGLEGKKAIVTGGAYGIGKAIATRLMEEGCDVGILDVDGQAAAATAGAMIKDGRTAAYAAGDVSSKDSVVVGLTTLTEALGRVDILVNNAGVCRLGNVLDMSEGDWRVTFGINVDGLFHVSRFVVPGMVERRSGAVVNIASWMGKSGVPSYGAYCASKFAVVALTQALSGEVGEYGVRVNAVAPGLIVDTKMRDESELERRQQGLPTAQDRAATIPLRRPGYPDEIARTVAFLASEQAAYITGETINVTGGLWND